MNFEHTEVLAGESEGLLIKHPVDVFSYKTSTGRFTVAFVIPHESLPLTAQEIQDVFDATQEFARGMRLAWFRPQETT